MFEPARPETIKIGMRVGGDIAVSLSPSQHYKDSRS